MKIVDNKALLLRLRNPAKITTIIPRSKQVGDTSVLVHWGVDEAQVLNNIGIKAPSPITGQYTWPGMYPPFEHQRHTAGFLTLNQRGFCFSEQGTGKTASAIWASDFLLAQGRVKRVLIICPLSIMNSAWRDDLFNVAMHRKVDIAHGSAEKRRKVIASDAQYVIINYDGVEVVIDAILKGGFDLIIVDEATHYKNVSTARWKALNALITPSTWVWLMTGTPAAQNPTDAYGLAKLVNPSGVPRFFGAFRDKVMYKVTNFRWVPKQDAATTVHEALQPAIRYTKEECLDLPDMVYVAREVPLTAQQNKYYKEVQTMMRTAAAGEDVTAANAAIVMNKLLQIAGGAVYTDSGEALEFDITHRYKVLKEVIDEATKKVIVFVPFKHAIDLLSIKLNNDGVSAEIIRGDVTLTNRTDRFKRFQTEADPKVLIIQPQSAAHGVTLTAADTIVWWGPVPSLETYLQANARIHRAGQTNKCTVIQLQGSGVERHIYAMLDNKIDIHTKMIDLYSKMLD